MEHYKNEHYRLLRKATTLVELALWKAKLLEGETAVGSFNVKAKKAKIDIQSARQEKRVTCGAGIVIKNVLPFLLLS
jgi:hypothetical protein